MTRSVKSAERTLALLELFSARQEPVTVGQITKMLAIPQASASMLLGSLRARGYLSYDRRRRTYAPTIRVTLLGRPSDGHPGPGDALREQLRDLRDRLDLPVFLSVQNEAMAQVVFELARRGHPSPGIRADQSDLLTHCAAGLVLLSGREEGEVVGWAHRCGAEIGTGEPRVAASDLLRIVRQVRSDGYAHSGAEATYRHGAIAVLLAGLAGVPRMAVGAGLDATISDARRAMIVRELKKVAGTQSVDAVADRGAVEGLARIAAP